MPHLVMGDTRLFYQDHGAGPAVVLAHGVGGNHASWFRQVPTLAAAHRVISFDHRAFGNSGDAEGVGRSAHIGDLLGLLDALEIEQAVLVGQSMGGGTCAGFTLAHPDRVAGLVIACSLAGAVLPPPLAEEMRAVDRRTAELSQLARVLGPKFQAAEPEQSLLYLELASFNSVNVRTVRGVAPVWSPEALGALAKPVLYVAGEDDVLFPAALVRAAAALTPGARYVEMKDSGHSAYFETPQAFNGALLDFLKRVPGFGPSAR